MTFINSFGVNLKMGLFNSSGGEKSIHSIEKNQAYYS